MRPRQEIIVLVIFLIAQLLDGLLTYKGIRVMGLEVEANQLLVFYIEAFGAPSALIGAKVFASVCGLVLYVTAYYRLLAAAAGAYLGVAVVPWLLTLSALSWLRA
jgi:hypothetical protein